MTRVTTPSREVPPTFVDWRRTRSPTSGMGRFPWLGTWSDARVRTLLFGTVTELLVHARTPSGRRAGGNIGYFGTDSSKSWVGHDLRS
jgi:hypothetical protein